MSKNKVIVGISLAVVAVALAMLTIVSVWAVSRQTFSSSFDVRYTARSVTGSASAQWRLGESGTWNDMSTASGAKTLKFDENPLDDNVLKQGQEKISLTLDNNFVVFSFYFQNTGADDFVIDLRYNDTASADKNVSVFTLTSDTKIESDFLNKISTGYGNWVTTNLASGASKYIYILAKITNENSNLIYSGNFNFNLDGKNYSNDLTFQANGSNYTVTGLKNNVSNLYIPSTYMGSPITQISANAFAGKTSLQTVTIPDSVTTIGSAAFTGCSGLKYLQIPFVGNTKSATSASASTRFGYIFGSTSYNGGTSTSQSGSTYYIPTGLTNVAVTGGGIISYSFFNCANLKNVTLQNVTGTIGASAFYSCKSLGNIVVPYGVSRTNTYAFGYCTNLTTVILPDTVTIVDQYVFDGCSKLTDIIIPNSISSINYNVFRDCNNLQYNYYGNAKYLGNDTNPYVVLMKAVSPDITDFEINDETKIIYFSAFEGCSQVNKELNIPNGVKSIYTFAFNGCSSLTSLTVPSSVVTINEGAFAACGGLTSITVDSSNYTYTSRDSTGECDAIIRKSDNALVLGCRATRIPTTAKSIASHAFEYCKGLTSITIPSGVTTIGATAFIGCTDLVTVELPSTVTTIGTGAFQDCENLTTIDLSSVRSFNAGAFYNCKSLTSITISTSCTSIWANAFYGCTGVTEINYNIVSTSPTIVRESFTHVGTPGKDLTVNIGSSVSTIPEYLFYNSNITTLNLGSNVTTINQRAFYGCQYLTTLNIPTSSRLATIDEYAFCDCSNMAVTSALPSTITSVGTHAFSGCRKLTGSLTMSSGTVSTHAFDVAGLSSFTISGGAIDPYAFYGCTSLESVSLGSGVTRIGDHAFESCSSLRQITYDTNNIKDFAGDQQIFYAAGGSGSISVTIGSSVKNIPAYLFFNVSRITSVNIGSNVSSIGENAFFGCGLTSITIPASVTTIGRSAFFNCNSVTTINYNTDKVSDFDANYAIFPMNSKARLTIGSSVTHIPAYLFHDAGITSISIGSGVRSIGDYAFHNSKLTSLAIPSGVETIGTASFGNCVDIQTLTISNTVTTIGVSAFFGCKKLTTVTIPSSVKLIDANAFYDCIALTRVRIESADVYKAALGDTHSGFILYYATTVEVSASIVSANSNSYLNNTTYYSKSTSTDGAYTVFTKK